MTENTALTERSYYDGEGDEESQVEKLQFLVFQSGNGMYGVNILETHEILKEALDEIHDILQKACNAPQAIPAEIKTSLQQNH